jgi:hypothetical protein
MEMCMSRGIYAILGASRVNKAVIVHYQRTLPAARRVLDSSRHQRWPKLSFSWGKGAAVSRGSELLKSIEIRVCMVVRWKELWVAVAKLKPQFEHTGLRM